MTYVTDSTRARLVVQCPDKPGIVAAITQFLSEHQANITCLDQHSTGDEVGQFFLRLEFQTPKVDVSVDTLANLFEKEVASRFHMDYRFRLESDFKKVAVLVSKHDHAFLDLLWRYNRRELPVEIAMIVSNHPDMKVHADAFGIEYHQVSNDASKREEAETSMLSILNGKVDGVILARYMQILSKRFVEHFPNQIINIHHSFLPAFVGAKPYQQAHEKGVKLIGATAHYVTEELDMGPIIEQDVARVSHRLNAPQLQELGKDIERRVLAKAVKLHLEDRVFVHQGKTVVFDAS